MGPYFKISWSNNNIVPTLDESLISILVLGSRNNDVFPALYFEGMGQIATAMWLIAKDTRIVFWKIILGVRNLFQKAGMWEEQSNPTRTSRIAQDVAFDNQQVKDENESLGSS